MDRSAATELADEFGQLARFVHHGTDPGGALSRLVTLAVKVIPGCDWAAIMGVNDKRPRTLAASDPTAQLIDDIQTESNQGPCLTAGAHPGEPTVVYAPDLSEEKRWPTFVERALATTPARSILACELGTEDQRSALNLYSGRPNAFTPESVSIAALFVSHAQPAMMHLQSASKSANLMQALTTSRQIGAAVGILMVTHKITEEQAFLMLRDSSQHLNRKLRDVAGQVAETGMLP